VFSSRFSYMYVLYLKTHEVLTAARAFLSGRFSPCYEGVSTMDIAAKHIHWVGIREGSSCCGKELCHGFLDERASVDRMKERQASELREEEDRSPGPHILLIPPTFKSLINCPVGTFLPLHMVVRQRERKKRRGYGRHAAANFKLVTSGLVGHFNLLVKSTMVR
jgi:hypothetical protein